MACLAVAPSALAKAIGRYDQRNLVSDQAGKAELKDPDLVNAWGLAFGPTTPAWVADNGTDVSTLYTGGVGSSPVSKVPLTVSIPGGAPTGLVFNGSDQFTLSNGKPALFIFASEAGMITGWNQMSGTSAQTAVTVPGAIFKGLAIANTASGPRIYASDFHNRRVDVFDGNFAAVNAPGAFRDPALPRRYAPFGIDEVNGDIWVTYAKQDKDAEDDVPGHGHGFVDVYDTSGKLLRRFASHGTLNSPWGLALAPQGFGRVRGAMLVGNFGNGRINAFDPVSGDLLGQLRRAHGRKSIKIPGLWALEFGNGVIGTPRDLLFTAGPGDESHGLFGEVKARRRR